MAAKAAARHDCKVFALCMICCRAAKPHTRAAGHQAEPHAAGGGPAGAGARVSEGPQGAQRDERGAAVGGRPQEGAHVQPGGLGGLGMAS